MVIVPDDKEDNQIVEKVKQPVQVMKPLTMKQEFVEIVNRVGKIFGMSCALKFAITLGMLKLNPVKIFDARTLTSVFRYGLTTAAVSGSFLLLRWLLRMVKKLFSLRQCIEGVAGRNSEKYFIVLRNLELFMCGIISSYFTKFYIKQELEIVKVFMFMRAVEGALIILRRVAQKIVDKLYQFSANDDGAEASSPFKVHIPYGASLLPMICITIAVYAKSYETYAINPGTHRKIDDVF